MSENIDEIVSKEWVDTILSNFYRVYNELGYGFLENVYKNALCFALKDEGLKCETEKQIKVYFDGHVVGTYYADIMIEDCIILELKTDEVLNPAHEAQLINYLKATEIEIGYLLNFGKTAKFCRKIFSNSRKYH